jgi:hypothetical protein
VGIPADPGRTGEARGEGVGYDHPDGPAPPRAGPGPSSIRPDLERVPALPGRRDPGLRLLHCGDRRPEDAVRAVRHPCFDPAGPHLGSDPGTRTRPGSPSGPGTCQWTIGWTVSGSSSATATPSSPVLSTRYSGLREPRSSVPPSAASRRPVWPGPLPSHQLPVPPEERLGADQERAPRFPPEHPARRCEERLVGCAVDRPLHLPAQICDLGPIDGDAPGWREGAAVRARPPSPDAHQGDEPAWAKYCSRTHAIGYHERAVRPGRGPARRAREREHKGGTTWPAAPHCLNQHRIPPRIAAGPPS